MIVVAHLCEWGRQISRAFNVHRLGGLDRSSIRCIHQFLTNAAWDSVQHLRRGERGSVVASGSFLGSFTPFAHHASRLALCTGMRFRHARPLVDGVITKASLPGSSLVVAVGTGRVGVPELWVARRGGRVCWSRPPLRTHLANATGQH